jgi:hypothetical protein
MASAHLHALKKKHADIEEQIRLELCHPSADPHMIRGLKEKKLHLKEEIERQS